MSRLTIYRILSYALLPVAALVALFTLFFLLMAIGNVTALFFAFITGATVIYIFASFTFLQKGIDAQVACKPSLKDWVKVNAYAALFFAAWVFFQVLAVLIDPATAKQADDYAIAMQAKNPFAEAAMLRKAMKGVMYLMLIISVALYAHIFITFRLLKKYNHLFEKTVTPE